jgi:hypothetical protein
MRLRHPCTIGILLVVLGVGTCSYGRRYEVAHLSPETVRNLPNTDWIGAGWLIPGILLSGLGVSLFAVGATRSRAGPRR